MRKRRSWNEIAIDGEFETFDQCCWLQSLSDFAFVQQQDRNNGRQIKQGMNTRHTQFPLDKRCCFNHLIFSYTIESNATFSNSITKVLATVWVYQLDKFISQRALGVSSVCSMARYNFQFCMPGLLYASNYT